jgi:hypothetical protein
MCRILKKAHAKAQRRKEELKCLVFFAPLRLCVSLFPRKGLQFAPPLADESILEIRNQAQPSGRPARRYGSGAMLTYDYVLAAVLLTAPVEPADAVAHFELIQPAFMQLAIDPRLP